jgi:hypothetical protein
MKPESRALGQALLDHHKLVTKTHPPGKKILASKYTIQYGVLCSQAAMPHLVRIVGTFLGEIAQWCADCGYPPLNALAVNESGVPGVGYDGAGGFKASHWDDDAEKCVRFVTYPAKMP